MERFLQNTNLQNFRSEKLYHDHNDDHDDCYDDEDKEEALSLRDLPLNNDQTAATESEADHHDPAAELFEFLSSSSDEISPAENIIFRGKIIPLNEQNALRSPFSPPRISRNEVYKSNVGRNASPRIRVRSESLSAIQGNRLSRSGSVTGGSDIKLTRNSRSLDYRKLTRVSSIVNSPPERDHKFVEKGSPAKIAPKPDTASFGGKGVRPRWYVIMFGMVKFPPQIELRDIKSRQTRRNISPAMFPSPIERSSGRSSPPSSSPSSSWRFLKALSCKEPTSVAATAPFWVPHA